MKGLWKHISPFAPDQSGATSVLCEMGGLIVIIDAGGCAGNICGFDEPRWFAKKSAIFSAGLRDMDAILGRDDKLVEKIVKACQKIDGNFVALIGTPVPAVIGTDYKALRRMIEAKTGIPCLSMDTTGVAFYDSGAEKAWLSLVENFVEPSVGMEAGILGILGATPFDVNMNSFDFKEDSIDCEKNTEAVLQYLPSVMRANAKIHVYGMGNGLEDLGKASAVTKHLVVAPSALKAARYLAKRFGVPYEVGYPLESIQGYDAFLAKIKEEIAKDGTPKRILIAHQQVLAHTLREELRKYNRGPIVVGNWFQMDKELREPWDIPLKEEDQWIDLLESGQFDIVIGDELLRDAAKGFKGRFFPLNHFAISGKALEFI